MTGRWFSGNPCQTNSGWSTLFNPCFMKVMPRFCHLCGWLAKILRSLFLWHVILHGFSDGYPWGWITWMHWPKSHCSVWLLWRVSLFGARGGGNPSLVLGGEPGVEDWHEPAKVQIQQPPDFAIFQRMFNFIPSLKTEGGKNQTVDTIILINYTFLSLTSLYMCIYIYIIFKFPPDQCMDFLKPTLAIKNTTKCRIYPPGN